MRARTLPIQLTGLEVVFLTDSILNRDVAEGLPDRDAYVPLARQTLLLLGSAYREVVSASGIAPGPVTLHITEEMAWLLRSKVRTGDVAIDGKTNIGATLLLKLYAILEEFNAGVEDLLLSVDGIAWDSTVEEPESSLVIAKQRLQELKEADEEGGSA